MGVYTGTITGKLISQATAKETLSEGPVYFLIPEGEFARWNEILVRKKVHLWENDPVLHPLIGKKVAVMGEIIETKDTITIDYEKVAYGGQIFISQATEAQALPPQGELGDPRKRELK